MIVKLAPVSLLHKVNDMLRLLNVIFVFLMATAAVAQTEIDAARASIALEDARSRLAAAEAAPPEERLRAFAASIQSYETALAALRSVQRGALRERVALEAQLEASSAQTAALLTALQRIEGTPVPALLLHPDGPEGAARAGMMVAEIMPGFQSATTKLTSDLHALARIKDTETSLIAEVDTALANLRRAEAILADDLASKGGAVTDPDPTLVAMANALGGSMDALTDLLNGFNAPVVNSVLEPPFPLPVVGKITGQFGAQEAGGPRKGIVVTARSGGLVVAPFDASVRFAGPFQGYGGVMMLEPAPGTLLVLTGLIDIKRSSGESVLAGDPIGALAPNQGEDEVFLMTRDDGGADAPPSVLYMEFRQDGVPVDPVPWFTANK